MMKKICFIMPTPFTYGGEQRVVSKIANLLAEDDYDVSIMCTDLGEIDYEIYSLNKRVHIIDATIKGRFSNLVRKLNYKIRKLNSYIGILKNSSFLLKKLLFTSKLKKKMITILNENTYDYIVGVSGDYSLFLACYKEKIKVDSQIIGWQHNNYKAYFETKGRRFFNEKKLFKKYCMNFDNYIVLMDDDKKWMQEKFNLKVTKIFNPLSFDKIISYDELVKKKETKSFIWFGRMAKAKGVDLLLKSYKKYLELGGTWELKMVGNGPEYENIKKEIEILNLKDKIKIYDFTKNVEKYLKTSDVFLFPSRWEGFGLTLTEAMSYGLPTVCYKLNPFLEITEGFQSCIMIECFDYDAFANAMKKIEDKDLRTVMGREALANAEVFSGAKIIEEWKKL